MSETGNTILEHHEQLTYCTLEGTDSIVSAQLSPFMYKVKIKTVCTV